MNTIYISKNYKEINSAGNKAKTDIEYILASINCRNAGLKQTIHSNAISGFILSFLGIIKAFFSIRKGEVLVLQYPFKKYYVLACRMAHFKGSKVVTVIHDLGSFRRKKLSPEQEIIRLSNSDYIIAHNDSMKKWLLDNGYKKPVDTLGIFDYLSKTKPSERTFTKGKYDIIYAGTLHFRKNTFLYEWGDFISDYNVTLYGNGLEISKMSKKEKFSNKGFVKSDELIQTATGDFGLIWDGASIDGCTGDFGTYLMYNNPHKASLYIRCHLPLIIWEKAGLASFVHDNNIGFCIDSLEELNDLFRELTEEEYNIMKSNVVKVSDQLANGHFIKSAIERSYGILG